MPKTANSKSEEQRDLREQMFLRLLIQVGRTMTDELLTRLKEAGSSELQDSYVRLLGNLDVDGTRLIALARRMGVSRQAASQLVQEIESRGYIERRNDPDDKRGIVVAPTAKGRKLLAQAIKIMTEIEHEYAREIGSKEFEQVRRGLFALAQAKDPKGGLGLP